MLLRNKPYERSVFGIKAAFAKQSYERDTFCKTHPMKEATCESMVTNEVTSEVTSENRIFRTCTPIKIAPS